MMIQTPDCDYAVDPAQLAAAAFLARYSGRTLDAYRHDLRGYFQWATAVGPRSLPRPDPHRAVPGRLEERGLAASTIDRRLSTVCGFYRFAHIDGRVAANPAQYVRRPQVHPTEGRGWTAPNSADSSSPPSAMTTTTPPWQSCSA